MSLSMAGLVAVAVGYYQIIRQRFRLSVFGDALHRRLFSLLALIAFAFLFIAAPGRAQQPDSTRRAPADTMRTLPANTGRIDYRRPLPGKQVHRKRPARLPAIDAPALLKHVSGSFVYDFGTPGWPDGWSPRGLSPQRVSLRFNALPFDDLITGRPRYDLLPLAFMQPLHVGAGADGGPVSVYGRLRRYKETRPLTELRYRTGSNGLQSIMALHTQRRRLNLLGRPGRLHVMAFYGGHAGGAAYPNSRLQRMRQTYVNARYQRPQWTVAISNLHNRRHLGAQGGVLTQGSLSTLYTISPSLVPVSNGSAERQTIRNDLRLQGSARMGAGWSPTSAALYWTAQTTRYRLSSDSAAVARSDRYGLHLTQHLRLGRHRIRFRLDARTDHLGNGNLLADSLRDPRRRLTVAGRDSLRLGPIRVSLEGQLHTAPHLPLFTGALHLQLPLGPITTFLALQRAGAPSSPVAELGLGRFLQPANALPTTRLHLGRVGISLQMGILDASLTGFAQRLTQPWDYVVTDPVETLGLTYPTTATVRTDSVSLWRAGVALRVGLRRRAERGFYLTAQPSFIQPLTSARSPFAQRLATSRPRLSGRARVGARYEIFKHDLDLDVYAQGRFWTGMQSRGLHPATALLALLPADARRFGPAGTLDLHVNAHVRTATLFLAYKNALSGTPLYPGTLIVPVHPLPAQQLRFGVFWPISG